MLQIVKRNICNTDRLLLFRVLRLIKRQTNWFMLSTKQTNCGINNRVQRFRTTLCDTNFAVPTTCDEDLFSMDLSVQHTENSANELVNNPEKLKHKGLKFCRDFIGGAWAKVSYEEFQMKPISGGLTNYLYSCTLPDHVSPEDDEPRSALIRFYGQMSESSNPQMVIRDSVVFALLAEKRIGPKLYGIFKGGRVEEYIPSRCLRTNELHDANVSSRCAVTMAKLHKLKMPIKKEPKWLFANIDRWLHFIQDKVWTDNEFLQSHVLLPTLKNTPLQEEYQELREILGSTSSAVVFCHNDFQEGNILQFHPPDGTDGFMAIDFEYCSYNYRGFDFANHFCEWCYNYTYDEAPYYLANLEDYPTKEQQRHFFRTYLTEMQCTGDIDTITEGLIDEANVFALASHFFWTLWSIVSAQSSQITFGYVEYAQERLKGYYQFKEKLLHKRKMLKDRAVPVSERPSA